VTCQRRGNDAVALQASKLRPAEAPASRRPWSRPSSPRYLDRPVRGRDRAHGRTQGADRLLLRVGRLRSALDPLGRATASAQCPGLPRRPS
jgi:hypothetical protein